MRVTKKEIVEFLRKEGMIEKTFHEMIVTWPSSGKRIELVSLIQKFVRSKK